MKVAIYARVSTDDKGQDPLNQPARINIRWENGGRRNVAQFFRCGSVSQIGVDVEARASYEKALALARQEPEHRFLARRLEELK